MNKTLMIASGVALFAGCVSVASQSSAQLAGGYGDGETRTYDVAPFTGLDVATGIQVVFTTGGVQSVVAENENGVWDKLEVKVKDDTLHLQRKYQSWGWGKKKEQYKVTVTAPQIDRVETSSGSSVKGSGVSGDRVVIDTSSGSSVRISDISAGELTLDTSSGASVTLSGSCSNVSADTSSGSSLRAQDMVCNAADLEASSGSSLSITATERVNADASSGSSINVSGSPSDREIDKSSGASVNIRS